MWYLFNMRRVQVQMPVNFIQIWNLSALVRFALLTLYFWNNASNSIAQMQNHTNPRKSLERVSLVCITPLHHTHAFQITWLALCCCRSKETNRDDFIFYSKRLMRFLIEDVMSMLPFRTVTVDTPQGFRYEGKRLDVKQVNTVRPFVFTNIKCQYYV